MMKLLIMLSVLIVVVVGITTNALSTVDSSSAKDMDLNLTSVAQAFFAQYPMLPNQDVLVKGLKLLNDLETASSCTRLAAHDLISSCQILDDKNAKQNELALENIESIYATRLALCEIHKATAMVPPQCSQLLPHLLPEGQGSSAQSRVAMHDPAYMKTCLRTLSSRAQWWTSYSNRLRDAVLICKASRNEIEKENILDVYRAMTEGISDLHSVLTMLKSHTKDAFDVEVDFHSKLNWLKEEFKNDFGAQIQKANDDLMTFTQSFRNYFNQIKQDVSTFWHEAEIVSRGVVKDVHDAKTEVAAMSQELIQAESTMQSLTVSLSETSRLQMRSVQDSQAIASNLDNISSLMIEKVDMINASVTGFNTTLEDYFNHLYSIMAKATNNLEAHTTSLKNLTSYVDITASRMSQFKDGYGSFNFIIFMILFMVYAWLSVNAIGYFYRLANFLSGPVTALYMATVATITFGTMTIYVLVRFNINATSAIPSELAISFEASLAILSGFLVAAFLLAFLWMVGTALIKAVRGIKQEDARIRLEDCTEKQSPQHNSGFFNNNNNGVLGHITG